MINFILVGAEGFGSIRDEVVFDLNNHKLNILYGPNGAGKTSIFNALYYCLYGENLKGVTKSKLATKKDYRTKEFKGTRVICQLSSKGVTYSICRHIAYKGESFGVVGGDSLLIAEDGKLMDHKQQADAQAFIIDLIGYDKDMFLSTILFGQRMKRFIEGSGADKKALFESLVNISFVDELKLKVDKDIADINSKIVSLDRVSNEIQNKILSEQRLLDQQQTYLNNFNESKANDIKIVTAEVDRYKDILQGLDHELSKVTNTPVIKAAKIISKDEYKVLEDKFMLLSTTNQELTQKISYIKFSLGVLADKQYIEPNLVCDSCGQSLSESIKKELKKKLANEIKADTETVAELEGSLIPLEVELKKIKAEQESIQGDFSKAREATEANNNIDLANLKRQNNIDSISSNIKNNTDYLSKAMARLEEVTNRQPITQSPEVHRQEIANLNKDLKDLVSRRTTLHDKITIANYWSSTGLSSKGLKGFLLNSALISLNHTIKRYTPLLGLDVTFTIDTDKVSKPFITECSINGVAQEYEEFSGGEKAKIDVATAFALHDIVSQSYPCNILILDEVFEGLDAEGYDNVFEIVVKKSEGLSLFLISHSPRSNAVGANKIGVSKIDDTTIFDY